MLPCAGQAVIMTGCVVKAKKDGRKTRSDWLAARWRHRSSGQLILAQSLMFFSSKQIWYMVSDTPLVAAGALLLLLLMLLLQMLLLLLLLLLIQMLWFTTDHLYQFSFYSFPPSSYCCHVSSLLFFTMSSLVVIGQTPSRDTSHNQYIYSSTLCTWELHCNNTMSRFANDSFTKPSQ